MSKNTKKSHTAKKDGGGEKKLKKLTAKHLKKMAGGYITCAHFNFGSVDPGLKKKTSPAIPANIQAATIGKKK